MDHDCCRGALLPKHTILHLSPESVYINVYRVTSVLKLKLCCRFEARAILFPPQSLSSLSCIIEYLAINSGGNANRLPKFSSNCIMAQSFPEKSSWCWNDGSLGEGWVKCNALRAV